MLFYLGTHLPSWLGRTSVPLFISHRRLTAQKTWHEATGPWALDSGGFSEVSMFGEFQTTPEVYAKRVGEYSAAIGPMDWAAPQDWMCEPFIVAKTGLSVAIHQQRTIDNYLDLKALGGPFIPVLQGWQEGDYHRHMDMYARAGIDLLAEPVVGVGSVCRRQNTDEAARIFGSLADTGIRTHGFGVKTSGLSKFGHLLESADSMAWSFHARRDSVRLPGHPHMKCSSCLPYALQWRERVVNLTPWDRGIQLAWQV